MHSQNFPNADGSNFPLFIKWRVTNPDPVDLLYTFLHILGFKEEWGEMILRPLPRYVSADGPELATSQGHIFRRGGAGGRPTLPPMRSTNIK